MTDLLTPHEVPDTEVEVPIFQLLQWRSALGLQIKTGLKHSQGSVARHVQKKFGLPRWRLKKTYDWLDEQIERIHKEITDDPA